MARLVRKSLIVSAIVAVLVVVTIQAVVYRPVSHHEAGEASTPVYYFGYGSNMPVRYLSNVRLVDVYASAPGVLSDHAIQFRATGLDYLEPAFAHLIPKPGESAFGVLHEIDADSLQQIMCTEGVSYRMVQLSVKRLDSQQTVSAWTLVSKPSDNTAVPSKRYLGLMLEGVGEHAALTQYGQRLAELDGFYWPVVSELAGTAIYAMIFFKSATADQSCSEEPSND